MVLNCVIKPDDVEKAVNFARENNLEIAVRGGGHNVAGFSTCDDGIVIDLSQMKNIEIDKTSQTVRAQGGLTWGEFDKATVEFIKNEVLPCIENVGLKFETMKVLTILIIG